MTRIHSRQFDVFACSVVKFDNDITETLNVHTSATTEKHDYQALHNAHLYGFRASHNTGVCGAALEKEYAGADLERMLSVPERCPRLSEAGEGIRTGKGSITLVGGVSERGLVCSRPSKSISLYTRHSAPRTGTVASSHDRVL